MVLAGPRVYFAMARDGLFAAPAGRVHPRFRAPASAIAAQAVWSAILVLSGTLSQLVSYTGFAVVLFSAVAVAALFVLSRREPEATRPFRRMGLSVGAGDLRRRQRADGRERDRPQPGTISRRPAADRERNPGVLVAHPNEEEDVRCGRYGSRPISRLYVTVLSG